MQSISNKIELNYKINWVKEIRNFNRVKTKLKCLSSSVFVVVIENKTAYRQKLVKIFWKLISNILHTYQTL